MLRPVDGGQSWLVGKLESTGESAGVQAMPLLRPPWQTTEPPQVPPLGQSAVLLHGPAAFEPPVQVWLQVGHDWMPSAVGKRSPVRNSSELSGRLRLEAPVEAAGLEGLRQAAGAGRQRPAVAGPYAGGEVQPGRVDTAAGRNRRGGRGGRGCGGRGGRWPRRGRGGRRRGRGDGRRGR